MNKLEIFNKAKDHLLTQMERSENTTAGNCLYRAPNGLKCAVGCLILDEHYSPELEGKSSDNIDIKSALEKSGIDTNFETIKLLKSLQYIHDQYTPRNWEIKLNECYEEHIDE